MTKLRHVAIIMDGNGRWADHRNLAKSAGHRAGADNVIATVKVAKKLGLEYLTLYAFSTENWKRPPQEVAALMGLLEEFLTSKLHRFQEEGIRLLTIGRTSGLPSGARKALQNAITATSGNTEGPLVLALNYGGRAELADTMQDIAQKVKDGKMSIKDISEETIARNLYCPELPDPELLIRTSGELRISNFMLWQLAYSEIYVTPVLWPDFNEEEFNKAIESYNNRERRFGGRLK